MRMLARLLLALLLAAFALPALANGPCHDAPVAAMTGAMPLMSHSVPHRGETLPSAHVCIGCIPLASLNAPALATPKLGILPPRRASAVAFDPATGAPPALPPPRRDV